MRRKLSLLMVGLALVMVLAGCSSGGLRPARAVDLALGQPEVAAWYRAHTMPRVIAGPGGADDRRWRNYRPAVSVDRVTEGLVVRLHARLGPAPRDLEVLMDYTGRTLSITRK